MYPAAAPNNATPKIGRLRYADSNRVGESNKTFVLSHHRASRSAHGGSNSY